MTRSARLDRPAVGAALKGDYLVTKFGCFALVMAVNVVLGAVSVNYLAWGIVGKSMPLWAAALIGLVFGEFTVPAAILLWAIHFFVAFPLVHGALR